VRRIEQRQHIRILTLKNAAWAFGGLLIVFIVVSAWNELKPENTSRKRLYERGSVSAPPAPETVEVSDDRTISDQTYANRGAERSLGPATPPARSTASVPPPPRRPTLKETRQRGGKMTITGDADGLKVEVEPAAATPPARSVPPDRF
jgi:hypothetical protein